MFDGLSRLIFCFFIVSVIVSFTLITDTVTANSNSSQKLIDNSFETIFINAPFIETDGVEMFSPFDLMNENRLSRCSDISYPIPYQTAIAPSLSSCLSYYRTSKLFIPLQ